MQHRKERNGSSCGSSPEEEGLIFRSGKTSAFSRIVVDVQCFWKPGDAKVKEQQHPQRVFNSEKKKKKQKTEKNPKFLVSHAFSLLVAFWEWHLNFVLGWRFPLSLEGIGGEKKNRSSLIFFLSTRSLSLSLSEFFVQVEITPGTSQLNMK